MIAAIVQARMASTRFPGKVLKKIMGKPVLMHIVERLRSCKTLDKIIVACPINDSRIISFCKKNKIDFFAGQEQDVLDRFYTAAKKYGIDTIVRITADCPLIDPLVVDKVVTKFGEGKCDYAANTIERTFPDGLDTEVFSFASLKRAWQQAESPEEREHVTPYMRNSGKFRLLNIPNETGLSGLIFTLDYPKDIKFIRAVYSNIGNKKGIFLLEDILALLGSDTNLRKLQESLKKRYYK